MNQADAKAVSELTYKEFASKKINIDIVDEGMSDFLKMILE